jgi:tol-pal system protein YbgF
MKTLTRVSCAVGFVLCLTHCASQKDVLILNERLMVLERQNQELTRQNSQMQKQLGKTSQNAEMSIRDRYASLTADMEKLQQDLLLQSGRIDEVAHQINRQTADVKQSQEKVEELNIMAQTIDQRTAEIERYLNLERSGAKPATGIKPPDGAVKPAAQAATTASTEEQLYNEARQAFDSGQMEKARQGFQQLIKTYPKSANADNAQFWIGETYFNEKWYEKAILEYQTVIEKYSKGNKVAAAMLKQGTAFLQLGDKANARLIFKELEKKYPKSSEAAIAAKKLKEL